MRKSIWLFLFILLASMPGFSQSSAQTFTTKEGNQLQIEQKPDKEIVMLGEPTFITLEIKNPTDQNLCRRVSDFFENIQRQSYQIKVVQDNGKIIRQPQPSFQSSTFSGCDDNSSEESYFIRKIFLPSSERYFGVGNFTITVEQEILMTNKLTTVRNSFSAKASTKITIIPTDDEKLGQIIESLGEETLNINTDAVWLFSSIEDQRKIKYHLQVLEKFRVGNSRDQTFVKHTSLYSLRKYNDDSAFEALKNNMSSPKNFTRFRVASSLLESRHPKALELLFEMRNDEEPFVRLIVVQGLGKIETDESTSLLREMLKDEVALVRKEAKIYFDKRVLK